MDDCERRGLDGLLGDELFGRCDYLLELHKVVRSEGVGCSPFRSPVGVNGVAARYRYREVLVSGC